MLKSYTVTVLTTVFLISICIVSISYIGNPYKMYPTVSNIGLSRPSSHIYLMRLHRPYDVERARPSLLILGSSRSGTLPPQLLQKQGEIGYNASIAGTTLLEIRRMVEHAHAISPLKRVFIGLDFQMFQEGASKEVFLDEPDRYRKINPSLSDRWLNTYQRLKDNWTSLFSVDVVMASWQRLSSNARGDKELEIRDDGTWDLDSNGARSPKALYRDLAQKSYNGQVAGKTKAIKYGELKDLLDFTDANGIQTILFIPPLQGLQMNTLAFANTWDKYLNWQRELVNQVSARNNDTVVYGVEDHPAVVLETIGAPDHLFRDGIHLSRRGGIEILTCLAGPCNSAFQPTRLDSQSIETYLARVDALRMQYAHDHPAGIADLRKWIKLD